MIAFVNERIEVALTASCDSLFHRETVAAGKERVQVLIGVSIRLSDGQIVMTSNGVVT